MARLNSNLHSKLTDEVISKLNGKKIYTVFDVIPEDSEKLMRFSGLSYKDILSIKQTITEQFGGKIKKAVDLLNIERNNVVPTGIVSLDNLLNGGLYPGHMYELCGDSSSGKTQLSHAIATNIVIQTKACIHYIDTKKDFCASRVHMILDEKGSNDEEIGKVMSQMKITRVRNIHQLLNFLFHLTSQLKIQSESPTKLIVIDSLPAILLHSTENHNTSFALNHLANVCKYLANEFHISLITTNLITKWREVDGLLEVKNQNVTMKPTLGKYWLHVPNTRLLIKKLQTETRQITVWKSSQLKLHSSCTVNITDSGVS
ncbi:DNA repair protein RAD51 homolog 4 [Orussus abietinus]|uniref:DNA repair protein RAD51 homolog 4 n=1 Tax=Orussus abietinus TaxID=222816 RepID=UPI000626AF60|nr:DNA repair protein RAD51 homolog 4 [Orussus abietinus]